MSAEFPQNDADTARSADPPGCSFLTTARHAAEILLALSNGLVARSLLFNDRQSTPGSEIHEILTRLPGARSGWGIMVATVAVLPVLAFVLTAKPSLRRSAFLLRRIALSVSAVMWITFSVSALQHDAGDKSGGLFFTLGLLALFAFFLEPE